MKPHLTVGVIGAGLSPRTINLAAALATQKPYQFNTEPKIKIELSGSEYKPKLISVMVRNPILSRYNKKHDRAIHNRNQHKRFTKKWFYWEKVAEKWWNKRYKLLYPSL